MLNGSIGDKLLLFALPLALTGMLQQFFNAADVAVVGRFAGANAMAAVGSNSAIIGLIVNGFVGISLGANVVISKFTGQHDPERISKCVHTSVLFSLIGGVVLSILGEIFAPMVLSMTYVPDDVFPMALLYLRIYLLGLPVIFLYNFEAAIFRSQGDTRTPLICLTSSGIINVGLNIFFVCVLGMAADGVAIATVIANLISSMMLLFFLLHRTDYIRLDLRKLRIHRAELAPIVRIGVPAGMTSMVYSISNILIQSAINSLGADVMAGSSAAFNIEIFAYYIVNGLGQACTTFVSQNYGAGKLSRCRRVSRISLVMNIAVAVIISVPIVVCGRQLLSLFNGNPAVIEPGMIRIKAIVSFEFVSAIMEIFSGSMRGYGYSLVPAVVTFVGVCGSRIIWVYSVFRMFPTFTTLMVIYPVSWIITCFALIAAYFRFMKKILPTLTA